MTTEENDQTPEDEGIEKGTEAEVAKAEAADWRDKYLRKLAEFDNYRKRARQELASSRDYVTEDVIQSLLPVIDDFDRLMENAPVSDEQYHRAVEMIYGKLKAYLDSRGVKKFESMGKPFDPELHDAVLMQPTPDFPAGTVLAVITPGYRMGERVIRHAQVVVSAEPELEEGKSDSTAKDNTGSEQ
jgi:molecular chaperone GrpE